MAKKRITRLNQVNDEWIIDMAYDFFQIIIFFPKLNPKLTCTINYPTWRRLLAHMRIQEMGHAMRKQKGEILWGIGDDRAHYVPVTPQKIITSTGEIKEAAHFNFTDKDKETGLQEAITVHIENMTLQFDRDTFLRFRDSLIAADEVLLKELDPEGYPPTPPPGYKPGYQTE